MENKLLNRSILIFPILEQIERINAVRNQYDPAVSHIRPHVTLVFPFLSQLDTETLRTHVVDSIKGLGPFRLAVSGVSSIDEKHMVLLVTEGKDMVIELHQRLYSGILSSFIPEFLKKVAFIPHLTIGSFEDPTVLKNTIAALEYLDDTFECTVDEICIEIIDDNMDSLIESIIKL